MLFKKQKKHPEYKGIKYVEVNKAQLEKIKLKLNDIKSDFGQNCTKND